MSKRGDKPQGPRCSGKRADGRRCRQSPIDGTTRCWHHSFKVPGRPAKLTNDVQDRILDSILLGASQDVAAQAAGVSQRTLRRWLERGDDAEAKALELVEEDEPSLEELYAYADPADWPYMDFRHAVKSAEAFAELELLRMVTRGGAQPWTAYMTVLERRHPSRWRRVDGVAHEGAIDVGKPRVVAPDSAEKRAAIAGVLTRAGALDLPDDPTTPEEPAP